MSGWGEDFQNFEYDQCQKIINFGRESDEDSFNDDEYDDDSYGDEDTEQPSQFFNS